MTKTTRITYAVSLLLVALTMGSLYAHVLEIVPKLHYPAELYLRLNNSLYAWYGPALGAAIQTGALAATGILAWLVRRQRCVRLFPTAACALQAAALGNYFARVEPVNVRFRALPPGRVPSDFVALRAQWDLGHALDFGLFVAAFLLLVGALLVRPPARVPARAPAVIR